MILKSIQRFFQFVFEGVIGSSYAGDIALDDIQIIDQSCSILPVNANPSKTALTTPKPVSTPKPIRKSCLQDIWI